MANVGFEPTPFQTSALNWRLRPLGQLTMNARHSPKLPYTLQHTTHSHKIIQITHSQTHTNQQTNKPTHQHTIQINLHTNIDNTRNLPYHHHTSSHVLARTQLAYTKTTRNTYIPRRHIAKQRKGKRTLSYLSLIHI